MEGYTILVIVVGAFLLLALYLIGLRNSLLAMKNRIENGWAQIETQLQRRYDLIPNLVETVKGYAAHEKELFESVTQARSGAGNASSVAEKAAADNALTGTLKTLFAVAENYPSLKADQNFRELQVELTNTENKISFARQFYNDTVAQFNIAIQMFPKNIVAGMLNLKSAEYFKTENDEVRKVPKVQF